MEKNLENKCRFIRTVAFPGFPALIVFFSTRMTFSLKKNKI